ncbi:head protein [Desulfofundulus sp. TPOSR]|uniref:Mu-like prophage major head subunit gpT family protein n=1 Tax=Desulfofundulus sp. TPOSR TaxID=2714340 RepID=UPI0014088E29|nr:Mu-like prophage major head subunit gpT family protein [Desulfofundulus sp. TPOSR]NHM25455.1 head protein [Desulfofundulus sp. TPOSR]NHM27043.1 head protein [Desulfofundulus sp. TPOSR]
MLLNAQNLKAAARGFRALFFESLEGVKTPYELLAMVVNSTSPEETYNWLASLPRMREWVGDRVIHALAAHGFTIKNKDWEATIEVDRNEIIFDKLNLVRPRIQMLARAAAEHYMDLIIDLLVNGFNQTCYDGQYFFDEDHIGGSNRTSAPLSATSYNAAYAAMMSLTDENGKPLNITPTHLVFGPALRATALEILTAERDQYGATNINRGSAEPLLLPQLAAHPTMWFLLDLSKPIKPFILQIVKQVDFVGFESLTDEVVFMKKKFLYGIDSIDNAGYGLWQLAYGSTGTA